MTSNVREFNLALADFLERQVPELALLAQKKVTLDALAGVVRKSPVDTGRFRGNWQVSAGEPDDLPIDRLDKQPSGSDPGTEVRRSGESNAAAIRPYSVSFVYNNLPYADPLERGHSRQAPQGMVALTIAELQNEIIEEAV